MKKKENVLDIKTVCECNRCLGSKTWHPQAAVINLENPGLEQQAVKFDFYAILLIEDSAGCGECCGRRYYDFAYATMVFLTPGEVFRMSKENTLPPRGLLLAFDPMLLLSTALCRHIDQYTFFHYRQEEALHLSQRETERVRHYFDDIDEELHHAIDGHSRTLLSRLIELLLDYCARYYERQFITREDKNKRLLAHLGRWADDYIGAGRMAGGRMPAAADCAGLLGLSEAYFGDLLRFETGQNLAEYFQLRRLEMAKRLLQTGTHTPAQVARQLGFDSIARFNLVFQKYTGQAPSEYNLN